MHKFVAVRYPELIMESEYLQLIYSVFMIWHAPQFIISCVCFEYQKKLFASAQLIGKHYVFTVNIATWFGP